MVPPFRVGLDRGFLNSEGKLAYGDIGIRSLEETPGIVVEFFEREHDELPAELIEQYDGLILGGVAVTLRSLDRGAGRLVVLCRYGVGYDRIDVEACTAHDIALCTTPAASKHPVASASFAYVLALAKRIIDKDRLVRQGRWDLRGAYSGNEIHGKTLGIVGFGNTGSELARLVKPFDMRVLAADPYASIDRARQLGVELVDLDELMRQSDFVCVHAHLDPSTRGLIGASQLALMKPSAYFINCARGPIVDERALVIALQQRRIAGAGLDVFEHEPLPLDNPLLSLENVVLSPHTMAHTFELGLAMGEINSRQVLSAARGDAPEGIVNRQVLESAGFQHKLSARRSASI
jgi:phosphoglycerate dehydrogenase-like enzyme